MSYRKSESWCPTSNEGAQVSWSERERQHMEAMALYSLVAAAGMPIGSMEAAALSTLPADWAALQAAVADAVAEREQEVAACQRELDSGELPLHRVPAGACTTLYQLRCAGVGGAAHMPACKGSGG